MSNLFLGRAAVSRFRATALPAGFQVQYNDFLKRVKDVAQNHMTHPKVESFGSYRSGFCQAGADADLSLSWFHGSFILAGHPEFDHRCAGYLHNFAKFARDAGFENVKYIEARTPIVSFHDPVLNLDSDISMCNGTAVENSRILRIIHDLHPVIPIYIQTIKSWAKAKDVVAPSKSAFNSFTMTTMALMVLQELGLLPVFRSPSGPFGELTVADVEKALAGHRMPEVYYSIGCSDDTMLAQAVEYLFCAFANYYSRFDWANGTVSLITPRKIRSLYQETVNGYLKALHKVKAERWAEEEKAKRLKANEDPHAFFEAMRAEVVQRPADTPFVVEDFSNMVNCGRRVNKYQQSHILKKFTELSELVATAATRESAVEQIFSAEHVLIAMHQSPSAATKTTHYS